MQQKYVLWTRLTYFWQKKYEENIVSEPQRFWQTCPSFLSSKFASQIKLIQSVVGDQLLVSGSQGPICRVLGVRISCPIVASPKFQLSRAPSPRVHGPRVPGSQDLGSWVPGLGSQGRGSQGLNSQVLILG